MYLYPKHAWKMLSEMWFQNLDAEINLLNPTDKEL